MSLHTAIILAAGNGTRMGDLTADIPKAMLDVGGRTLIERNLGILADLGVTDVTVVVGYKASRLRRHLADRVRYAENRHYRETNSLYSLWLASDQLAGGALVLNSDLLVSPALVKRLVEEAHPDAALVEYRTAFGPEEMKVRTAHGWIFDFGKDLALEDAHAENIGILKFGSVGGRKLAALLERLVKAGQKRAWAPLAFRELARSWPLRAVASHGLPWIEIDFPDDLMRARLDVAPRIAVESATGWCA